MNIVYKTKKGYNKLVLYGGNMKRKKYNYRLIILLIIIIFLIISNVYFIYSLVSLNGIETLIRILVIIILILLVICFLIRYLRTYFLKKKKFITYSLLLTIYSIIFLVIGIIIRNTLNKLDNLSIEETTYSISLVSLNNEKQIKKVGMLNNLSNIETELINQIINEKNIENVKKIDNYISLINELNNELDAIFLPSDYMIRLQNIDGVNLDLKNTKIIETKTKDIKNETIKKTLTEPFTVLLMGVDSEQENIKGASFNGDALMLISFNPKTLSTTILSIPRDSYVPIACFPNQKRNKITHAAWYGEKCMQNTIENLLDIKIDYYVKVNFKGVVKLVDTLGGIEMDIPYSFCEQNSNREWGNNTIYVEEGHQLLNGEQALAYSRNRHAWPQYCPKKYTNYIINDFIRGQHQQEVLKAILNKLKTVADFNTLQGLLNTISNNLETNMSVNEILSLYNIGKDILKKSTGNIDELISMQRLYLSGIDAYIYETSSKLNLYNYVLYEESIDEVSAAIKENLGIKEKENIKTFEFDSNEKYESKIIGKGNYSKLPDYQVVPDFIGDSKYQSGITANKLGIKVKYIYDSDIDGIVGTVVKQSHNPGTLISKVPVLTLTIKEEKDDTLEDKTEENIKEEE